MKVINNTVFDVKEPITEQTLFNLPAIAKNKLISWSEIEIEISNLWKSYSKHYQRFSGRKKEDNDNLKEIKESIPYAKLMTDLIMVTKGFLSKGQYWADLCCGKGRTIDFILEIERDIVIDAVEKYSPIANHLFVMDNIRSINKDNAEYLTDLEPNILDGVISNMGWVYSMKHQTKNGKTYIGKQAAKFHLKSIHSALKPDAPFIFSSPKRNVDFSKVFYASLPDMLNVNKWIKEQFFKPLSGIIVLNHARKLAKIGKTGLFHFYSPEEFHELLSEAGFYNINCKISFAGQDLVFSCQKR